MKKIRRWMLWGLLVFILVMGRPTQANGETGQEPDLEEWMAGSLDLESLDQFLNFKEGGGGQPITFAEIVKALASGNGKEAGTMILTMVQNNLFGEIRHGSQIMVRLLALGLIGAVFANFSDVFSGSQISETGFFMTYLLAFAILASGFHDSVQVVYGVLERQMEFMRALVPAYFLTVAWAGGSISSAAWYEVVLLLIGSVQWLYLKLLVPVTRIYILLVLAGHMAKEDMLSHMTGLLKTGISWGTKSLIGLVLGFQVIQGMVLPYADSVQTAGVQKVLQIIPGIGQGASAVTKMILGSGVLIKNTMGAAAILVLLIISLVPLLKLLVILLFYRCVAALIQPVGDKRLVSCISSVADGQKLLLGLVASALFLFVLTIALICLGTNVSYLA